MNIELSKRRKVILTIIGILFNFILLNMIIYGFELRDLLGLGVFAVVSLGIVFLWVE